MGNFSHTELEKAMAGKVASARLTLGEERFHISGSSTPTDVETMLQLVYLNFTKVNKDQESFDNTMKTTELMLKNKSLQPEAVFSDSLMVTLTAHDKRRRPQAGQLRPHPADGQGVYGQRRRLYFYHHR